MRVSSATSCRNSVPSRAWLRSSSGASASSAVRFGRDPRRVARVQEARAELDAAAGLGDEQHRRAQVGDALEPLLQLRDERRAAERGERQARLRLLAAVLQRAPDGREQLLQRDRLLEEIVGADARRLHRGVDRAVARHHHDRHRQQPRARPLLEQRDAVGVRHPDVEQHEIGARARCGTRAPRSRSPRAAPGSLLRDRISESSSRIPISSSTTRICCIALSLLLRSGRGLAARARYAAAVGKRDRHARAVRRDVRDRDFAAVLFDDFLHDHEAEARCLSAWS